jgi:hypothetical protein
VSRGGSLAALALSLALVVGSALALVGGMALGAWQPAGPSRQATPPPGNVPGFGSGAIAYDEFLAEVRAGRVYDVYRDGEILQVNGAEQPYTVEVPAGDPDVFGDMQAAAASGGVTMPGFGTNMGPNEVPEQLTYVALLELVQTGRVHEVFHSGDMLEVNSVDGLKRVPVPAGVDVLADIEAAAEAAGRPPPYYTKAPDKPPG